MVCVKDVWKNGGIGKMKKQNKKGLREKIEYLYFEKGLGINQISDILLISDKTVRKYLNLGGGIK